MHGAAIVAVRLGPPTGGGPGPEVVAVTDVAPMSIGVHVVGGRTVRGATPALRTLTSWHPGLRHIRLRLCRPFTCDGVAHNGRCPAPLTAQHEGIPQSR